MSSEILNWQHDAACADTPLEWWYPDVPGRPTDPDSVDGIPAEAHDRCAVCQVRSDCLDHALRHERYGVWAGTSARGRARMRRMLRIRLVEADPEVTAAAVLHLAEEGTPPQLSQSSSA